ncbi:MAG TPA: NAD-dependent epimerase/dehydratase family protein [Oligoflexia bacterium]|nr:NAD-dependent epimerase/dehydratase family protein [Oligoflexia bacterium]HMP49445.1 NAD-dependent epimerase/dehydratase family protein [Oligoflexia bacterium]
MKILVVGAGYLGQEILLEGEKAGHNVIGARRSPSPSQEKILSLDVLSPETFSVLPDDINCVVYSVSASSSDELSYLNSYVTGVSNLCSYFIKMPKGKQPEKFLFVSSTGVYSEDSGGIVTEESLLSTIHYRSRLIVEGERIVLDSFGNGAVIGRLSGIYGSGRNYMINQARSTGSFPLEDSWTNRIHKSDGARAIIHLLQNNNSEQVYIISDLEPALRSSVISFLRSEYLGMSSLVPDSSVCSDLGSKLIAKGKRCSSKLLRDTGFVFSYPTFREGYGTYFD